MRDQHRKPVVMKIKPGETPSASIVTNKNVIEMTGCDPFMRNGCNLVVFGVLLL